MQNYVGKQIDRYRIIERLGMGGMAVVYKAYDTRLERDVAIKLIRTSEIPESQHQRLFKRFEREAKAQAGFSHRNIIPVFDYGEVDGSPYLVMALVPGGTLKEHLNGPIYWQQAVQWLIPIADALAYAHKEGIIHRDVKPGNILFDKNDQPILTDFGIAKVLETNEATLTGTGLGVGTPEYMAPEQWQGQTSEATDQYALGVVLYELITGRKPYSADTPAAIILMQANEPLQAPSGLVQGIPDAVEKVLYKALAHNPQDRYENMDAFVMALRGLLANAKTAGQVKLKQEIHTEEAASELSSEETTCDEIDTTPMREIPHPTTKKEFPKWIGWAFGGIVGVILITLAISLGNKSANTPNAENTQAASIATETDEAATNPAETTSPNMTTATTLAVEPTLGVGSTMINEIDGAEMVYVQAGEFLMGSNDENSYSFESPEHTVYLDAYWIYKYEVTNEQYRECIMNGTCNGDLSSYPENDFPAKFINWFEANEYCVWAGGSLPTEAEWEKAARGDNGNSYPWGEASPTCNLANFYGCEGNTMPVGSYPNGASPYGALDMAGNVWEWVADWYDANYYQNSPFQNPTGPASGTYRVFRGGSWSKNERFLLATSRCWDLPDFSVGISFRCVFDSSH